MQKQTKKKLRWDRIGMVGAVLLIAYFGIAAMVPGGGEFQGVSDEGRVSSVIDQPVSTVGVQGGAAEVSGDLHVALEEAAPIQQATASVSPAPSGRLPLEDVAPCSCSKHTMKLARNPYTKHQKRARTLPGSFFVRNDAEIQAGFHRGDLVRVPDEGRGYHLYNLTHSEPFLLASTMKTLQSMAGRFADAMEGTEDEGVSIRITSLTRTQEQQARLRRRNSNAFNGKSTHSYGASFDIAFIDRPNNDIKCGGPSWALQSILQDMQEKGEILVIPEGNCMHITPRNS